MYTIKLADGIKLESLDKNGTNYVSKTKIDESIFKNNLSVVTVSDGETETTYHNIEFIQQMPWSDGTYYLAFREIPKEEVAITDLQLAVTGLYEQMLGGE